MSKHEESLIEEAEEVDPSIAQLPPHKVNKAESKKDPEEAFAGEQEEQSPAVDENFKRKREKLVSGILNMALKTQRNPCFKKQKMQIQI